MREVIDLLSHDSSAEQSSFDYDSNSLENPSSLPYYASKQDSLMSIGSVEAYTYDFERLFSIKGMIHFVFTASLSIARIIPRFLSFNKPLFLPSFYFLYL